MDDEKLIAEPKLRIYRMDYPDGFTYNGIPGSMLPRVISDESTKLVFEACGAKSKEIQTLDDIEGLAEKIADRIRYLHPHSYLPFLKDCILYALNGRTD